MGKGSSRDVIFSPSTDELAVDRAWNLNLHLAANMRNEIGLSDGYAEALGDYIAICVKGMHGNACGVMLVTHSRRLAEGLVRGLGRDPAMLSMGEAPNNVGEWIKSREERSVEELLGLRTVALERFRTVNRLLGRGRKEEVSDG